MFTATSFERSVWRHRGGIENPRSDLYADDLNVITQPHELPIREGWQVPQVTLLRRILLTLKRCRMSASGAMDSPS